MPPTTITTWTSHDETHSLRLETYPDMPRAYIRHHITTPDHPNARVDTTIELAQAGGVRVDDGAFQDTATVTIGARSTSPYGNPSKTVEHRIQITADATTGDPTATVQVQRRPPERDESGLGWTHGSWETLEITEISLDGIDTQATPCTDHPARSPQTPTELDEEALPQSLQSTPTATHDC